MTNTVLYRQQSIWSLESPEVAVEGEVVEAVAEEVAVKPLVEKRIIKFLKTY